MIVKLDKKKIGEGNPVFIIAEAGINHNGSLKIAKKMIHEAKKDGADAIKFQTFKADDLTSTNSKFFKLFKKLELSDNDFKELSKFAKKEKIMFLSTPFSENAIKLLSELNVPAFKIASGDLTNIPLIKAAAKKNKSIILSTGMGNLREIEKAVRVIESQGNKKIIIMHSVSSYPTPYSDVNLKTIINLKKKFNYPIGYSDNGPDLLVPLTAIALGATIIEKHFTLNRKMKGPDQLLSVDPNQLKEMVEKSKIIKIMLGDGKKICQPSEFDNKINARRSITAVKTIKKGEKITGKMIVLKRPATGIEPIFQNKVIGKTAKKTIKINDSIKWENLL